MPPFDAGHLQIDLVGVHRAISVEGSPCGGELGATPADQRPAADGPTLRRARHRDPLASCNDIAALVPALRKGLANLDF
jgi:hypothetical protein